MQEENMREKEELFEFHKEMMRYPNINLPFKNIKKYSYNKEGKLISSTTLYKNIDTMITFNKITKFSQYLKEIKDFIEDCIRIEREVLNDVVIESINYINHIINIRSAEIEIQRKIIKHIEKKIENNCKNILTQKIEKENSSASLKESLKECNKLFEESKQKLEFELSFRKDRSAAIDKHLNNVYCQKPKKIKKFENEFMKSTENSFNRKNKENKKTFIPNKSNEPSKEPLPIIW